VTVRLSDSHAPSRSRLKRFTAAVTTALLLIGATIPAVQAAPDDVVFPVAGTATVNGAKDADYGTVPIGVFTQNGATPGTEVADLFAVYNDAGCSGNGELFVFIKLQTPGTTVRSFDDPSGLAFAYDNNDDGTAETAVSMSGGPAFNAARTNAEFSVCYTTVDDPGEGIAITFLFSNSAPPGTEGLVARLQGATTAGAVGLRLATPGSGSTLPSGLLQLPANPLRVLDTRSNVGLTGAFASKTWRTLQVTNGTTIPNDAFAVTGNLTIVNPPTSGYLSVLPEPLGSGVTPTVSNLNFKAHETAANNLIAPLNDQGELSIIYWAGGSSHVVFDVTGFFVPGSTGGGYVELTPDRIMDSRNGTGVSAGLFNPGVPKTFDVWGQGGVPNDTNVIAVAGNLTVTGQLGKGTASLTTTATGNPQTSTINFVQGDTRANGIVIKLDADGDLSAVVKGAKAHLLFDVTGYFIDDGSGATFHQINPIRLMDTRSDLGLSGPFHTGQPRTLTVAPNSPDIPTGIVGVTGNLTVTGQTSKGRVTMTDTQQASPPTSTINFPATGARANGVVSPVSADEASFVYQGGPVSATTELVFDATGYFQ
jgi:hypothetical protein